MNKKYRIRNAGVFVVLMLFFYACTNKKKIDPETQRSLRTALIAEDKSFSELSKVKGMKNAFIEFMDSNATLLRPGRLPILGADAVEYLIQQDDSAYTLTWEPHDAEVAASGDLGYTYGVYQLQLTSRDTTLYGSYVNIWKKQLDGKWKFVLDTGNEGIGNE